MVWCMQVITAFRSLGVTLHSVTMNYTAPADAIYNVIISKFGLLQYCNPVHDDQSFFSLVLYDVIFSTCTALFECSVL